MTPAQIAETFRTARLAAQALNAYPGEIVPSNLELAYRVQEIAISNWPDRIAGWKVAAVQSMWRETYPSERLAGPIFAKNVWDATRGPIEVPVIENGYAAAETEYAIHLGRAIPPSVRFTESLELLPYIEGVYAAIELAASPLATLSALGPGAVVSDFGNNGGLVIGPKLPITSLSDPVQSLTMTELNQVICGQGDASRIPGGPLSALMFLVQHLAGRGRILSAGDWISTGASTGVHKVGIGDHVKATFNGGISIVIDIRSSRIGG